MYVFFFFFPVRLFVCSCVLQCHLIAPSREKKKRKKKKKAS